MIVLSIFFIWTTLVKQHFTHAGVLNIGIADWISRTLPNDFQYVQSTLANFVIAQQHFNTRNTTFIPDLANLGNCSHTLNIIRICDHKAISLQAMHDAFDFIQTGSSISAFIGYSTFQTSQVVTQLADSFHDAPLLSHSSGSSKHSDKTLYPNFFRTCPNDNLTAVAVTALIRNLNYTNVAAMYIDSDSGPALADNMNDALLLDNRVLLSFSFTSGDVSSTAGVVTSIKSTLLNVIIVIAYTSDLFNIADAVIAQQDDTFVLSNQLWIFTYLDRLPSQVEVSNHPNLALLVQNSLRVRNTHGILDNNLLYNNYMTEWLSFASYVPNINKLLPPFGNGNDSRCLDSNLNASINTNFFANTVNYTSSYNLYAEAYDAVMAVGFATCLNSSTFLPQASVLLNNLQRVSFQGLSGQVQFSSTGDRLNTAMHFAYENLLIVGNGSLEPKLVAFLNADYYNLTYLSPIVFTGGRQPLETTPPVVTYSYLRGIVGLGSTELGVLYSFNLYCLYFVIAHRRDPVIFKSQSEMLLLVSIGCLLASSSIIFLSMDDGSGYSLQFLNFACQAAPFFYFFGFQLILSVLIVKTLRVASFYQNRSLKKSRLRLVTTVYSFTFGLVSVQLFILIVWTAVAPLQFLTFVVTNDLGQPISQSGRCTRQDNNAAVFLGVVFGLQLFMLGGLAWVANISKNLPSDFHESRFIGLAFLLLTQIFIIIIPVIITVYDQPVGRYVVSTLGVFVSVMIVLMSMFFPKMYLIHFGQELWTNEADSKPSHSKVDHRKDRKNVNDDIQPAPLSLSAPQLRVKGKSSRDNLSSYKSADLVDNAPTYEEAYEEGFKWRRWSQELLNERRMFVVEYKKWKDQQRKETNGSMQ